MSEQTQQPQDDSKVGKKFEQHMKSLTALLGGNTLLKTVRIGGDTINSAVEELLKEEKEKQAAEIKVGLKNLADEFIAFERFKKEKEKEFARLVTEKQKDFNKKAEAIFGRIDDLKNLAKTYYDALAGVSEEPSSRSTSGENQE